jgi:CRP/FNR family transcriptional regulator, cyclic AMP receptor protein
MDSEDEIMSSIDMLGYVASAAVLATFCMSTMLPLRLVAIGSNLLFISYGAFAHIYPVLGLHFILLPVNIMRLLQLLRMISSVKRIRSAELSINSILQFMSPRVLNAGDTLIRKGDVADRFYYLVKGQMKISEVNKLVAPGTILGEIGIFAHDQIRTATVVALTDCELYELSARKTMELYFQDPTFGFAVLQLMISRLAENMKAPQSAG